jgi:YD repeat-containing protein
MPSCRSRTFSYDSLGQLVSALNPESGTVTYKYDNAGNLLTRTDNRGVKTSFSYDGLNRLTRKTYSDSTSTVYLDRLCVSPDCNQSHQS